MARRKSTGKLHQKLLKKYDVEDLQQTNSISSLFSLFLLDVVIVYLCFVKAII